MILLLVLIAGLFIAIERLKPANALPQVKHWWVRVALINIVQVAIVFLAGLTWDKWAQGWSLLNFRAHLGLWSSAAVCYLVSTFVYYWWHRVRHESHFFWQLCHQLHHSPQRIEVLTSFYKHPVEILINSLISTALTYLLLGLTPEAAALYTAFTAVAEYFYHWNIRTPRWLGPWFQRPESHRLHHKRAHHTQNYADLPIWDILFGTYCNPSKPIESCGFKPEREERVVDMLTFKDVNSPLAPTCLGCSKRTTCISQRLNSNN